MKLARPDVFHPRIVLAGCPARPAGDDDDAGLVAALRRRGQHARWLSWDDPATLDADLVILRSVDGWRDRRTEFLAWTRRVRRLLNSPAAVAWNAGEDYRDDLARRGVPVTDRAADAVTGLVFFGGEQSHAVEAEPDWELWDVGRQALAAAAERLHIDPTDFLYARVDVTGDHRSPRVAALDLVAPSLGWQRLTAEARAGAERQFVVAVEAALDRFGLGPLSHRRP